MPKSTKKHSSTSQNFSSEEMLHICDILEKLWHMGDKEHFFLADPLDGLVQTILSQHTNDKNRDRAFEKLKARFPCWENAALAGLAELEATVAVAGLGKVKSRYIKDVLKRIKEDLGEYSLQKVTHQTSSEIREYLESLPGVGPKTAACVLLFQFHIPAFPVDTHVERVSKRIGIARKEHKVPAIERQFRSFLEEKRFLEVHLNFITHGRKLCLSRKPKCSSCPLEGALCLFSQGKNM